MFSFHGASEIFLRRRKDHSDIREILNAIDDELKAAIAASSTETTCVTADSVRSDKFPIPHLPFPSFRNGARAPPPPPPDGTSRGGTQVRHERAPEIEPSPGAETSL